ncbi:glucokinase [Tistrella bauzanensis]|uniref:Glucokinase n=1 Tax=Tistrella bauzanensis TaxID=657419 RepID=A0ABQ1IIP0_9PROT|nr:glucokinase [Tistrella bauzanensis]GGB43576.1 glucokinase [Tistrella bauzanensis]
MPQTPRFRSGPLPAAVRPVDGAGGLRRPEPADVLVADLGGTNLRIARRDRRGRLTMIGRAATADITDLAATLRSTWLKAVGTVPQAAAICVAGPVDGARGAAVLTNRPGLAIEARTLGAGLGLPSVAVVNDLMAQATGLGVMTEPGDGAGGHRPDDRFEHLLAGAGDTAAPRLLIGIGTGFGTALLLPGHHALPQVVPAEGGHIALAAETADEWAVIDAARALPGVAGVMSHVSLEDLVSGHGLGRLVAAVAATRDLSGPGIGGAALTMDPPALAAAAFAGDDAAQAGFALFSGWVGAAAGDLAIATGARGGVVLAGDLLHGLGPLFDRDLVAARFRSKGRFSSYLADVPLDMAPAGDDLALIGLARIADIRAARAAGPVFD